MGDHVFDCIRPSDYQINIFRFICLILFILV